jgi:hypothetical protein
MRRRELLQVLAAVGIGPLLISCSNGPETGPVEVRWDRMACERCRMVLSDRKHSAQVRFTDPGGRSRVMLFDDIGCAVVWLEDKPWKSAPSTEIWVNDHRDGRWIDARSAYYVGGQVTPMEYGLGAQDVPVSGALSFDQAVAHIWEIEKRFNTHGADVREQAGLRNPDADAPDTTSQHSH